MTRNCPECGQTYGEHVAFCFADGTPLVATPLAPTPPPVSRREHPAEPTPGSVTGVGNPHRWWWVAAAALVLVAAWFVA